MSYIQSFKIYFSSIFLNTVNFYFIYLFIGGVAPYDILQPEIMCLNNLIFKKTSAHNHSHSHSQIIFSFMPPKIIQCILSKKSA